MICPRCPERGDQSEDNFGISTSRKTGRNLYCKRCINKAVQAGRLAEKERRLTKRQLRTERQISPPLPDSQPLQIRIRAVLKMGPATYRTIRKEVRLQKGQETNDDLDATLADLQINQREVRSFMVEDEKYYALTAR